MSDGVNFIDNFKNKIFNFTQTPMTSLIGNDAANENIFSQASVPTPTASQPVTFDAFASGLEQYNINQSDAQTIYNILNIDSSDEIDESEYNLALKIFGKDTDNDGINDTLSAMSVTHNAVDYASGANKEEKQKEIDDAIQEYIDNAKLDSDAVENTEDEDKVTDGLYARDESEAETEEKLSYNAIPFDINEKTGGETEALDLSKVTRLIDTGNSVPIETSNQSEDSKQTETSENKISEDATGKTEESESEKASENQEESSETNNASTTSNDGSTADSEKSDLQSAIEALSAGVATEEQKVLLEGMGITEGNIESSIEEANNTAQQSTEDKEQTVTEGLHQADSEGNSETNDNQNEQDFLNSMIHAYENGEIGEEEVAQMLEGYDINPEDIYTAAGNEAVSNSTQNNQTEGNVTEGLHQADSEGNSETNDNQNEQDFLNSMIHAYENGEIGEEEVAQMLEGYDINPEDIYTAAGNEAVSNGTQNNQTEGNVTEGLHQADSEEAVSEDGTEVNNSNQDNSDTFLSQIAANNPKIQQDENGYYFEVESWNSDGTDSLDCVSRILRNVYGIEYTGEGESQKVYEALAQANPGAFEAGNPDMVYQGARVNLIDISDILKE